MLSRQQKEVLRDRTYELLRQVGMKVESEQLRTAMLGRGCEQGAGGRIKIGQKLIEEMAGYQKKTQQQDEEDQEFVWRLSPDYAHHIIWNGQQDAMKQRLKSEFLTSAFDCGPTKYYDYHQQKVVPVDTNIFIEIKKFAQATPEIGYISTWYRQDVPAKVERLESLVLGLKYTNKVDGIEAIYPEVIKYLKEASEIITGRAGDSSYLAGSECITSPLILEARSAADIIERKNCGIHRYHIASMPTIGVSTPVTIAGSVVMMAAELLGGMAACFAYDAVDDLDLSARPISLAADMRTANNTASSPEVSMVNLCTRELFDAFWGGHCWMEVYQSPYTSKPGLQAVFDNMAGGWRTAKFLNRPDIQYPGTGTLDVGATGSPTQFMLDMEIRKSQFAMKDAISIDNQQLPFDQIVQLVQEDGDFLTSEHTLNHFRELWSSPIFLTDPSWAGDEKTILDKCDQMWRENLKNYQPPEVDADKMKALEAMLARAKKELLD